MFVNPRGVLRFPGLTDGLPRCRLWPPLAAPPGRSSSLRCGRSTWTCGCAGGKGAAIEECQGLPAGRGGLAGLKLVGPSAVGDWGPKRSCASSGLVAGAWAIWSRLVSAGPGAVRTGMSHWAGTLLSRQAGPGSGREKEAGGWRGPADRSQDNPGSGCQPIIGPGPPPGSGVLRCGAGGGRPPGRHTA